MADGKGHRAPNRTSHGNECNLILKYLFQKLIGLKDCGKIDQSLVKNETRTNDGDWPWHCALFHSENRTQRYLCDCTLIRSNIVLTAAHCVSSGGDGQTIVADSVVVRLGEHDIQSAGPHTQQIRAERIIVHENFTSSNYDNNIAIIHLTNNATFNEYVQPICIDDDDDFLEFPAGWNDEESDNLLNQMPMPVVSNSDCVESLPAFYQEVLKDNNTFCAGSRNGECLTILRRARK